MKYESFFLDFDCALPDNVKESLQYTDELLDYLKQRKILGDLIEARMYSGQELYGEEIELEYRRLERMAQELNDKISE